VIVLTAGGEAALIASTLARSAEREQLVDELLDALTPGRGWSRRARRAVDRFQAAPFALYGLPSSWSGPRYLAGWATSRPRRGPERTTQVQLGHGDRRTGRGPYLLVEIDTEAWPRHGLADRLTHAAAAPAGPSHPGPEAWSHAVPQTAANAGTVREPVAPGSAAGTERAEIPVDGEPVSFDALADRRRWVAQGEVGDLVLTLEARDLPLAPVRLARLDDLGPYLADPRT
jgi:hypothetical protein